MNKSAGLCVFLLFGAFNCRANIIQDSTGFSNPTTIVLNFTGNAAASGPYNLGSGVTLATVGSVSVGNSSTSFGTNGTWTSFSYVANGYISYFDFAFSSPVAQVGVFMNYDPNQQVNPAPQIGAMGSSHTCCTEVWGLSSAAPISTPSGSNAGAFRGISHSSADIYYFRVQDSYAAVHSITFTTLPAGGAVPEPGTSKLIGAALIGLGFLRIFAK